MVHEALTIRYCTVQFVPFGKKILTSLFSADKGMAINEKIKVEEAQVNLYFKFNSIFILCIYRHYSQQC